MFRSTVWALCLIWMTNAIGAHAGNQGGTTPKKPKTHPCETKNGGCSQICGRVGNKAICSCKRDYILKKDKKSCRKHPCKINFGGCSQICGLKGNKAICSCRDEYVLMNDKKSCKERVFPDELTMPKGKFYVAVAEKKNWTQARAACQKMGGDLAQIRTDQDQKAVGKFLHDNWPDEKSKHSPEWWIGAKRDGSKKRKWKWVNGDKVSTDIPYNWDRKGLGHLFEKCFSIHRDSTYAFCASECRFKSEFVCERYHSEKGVLQGVLEGALVTDTVRTMPRGKFYVAMAKNRTWDQARATCQEMGGDLAQIRTDEDRADVAKFLKENWSYYTHGYIGRYTPLVSNFWWIGAKREIDYNGRTVEPWKWVNGDKVSKDIVLPFWEKKSCTLYMRHGTPGERCFVINMDPNNGPYNNFCEAKCTDALEFVCERYQYY